MFFNDEGPLKIAADTSMRRQLRWGLYAGLCVGLAVGFLTSGASRGLLVSYGVLTLVVLLLDRFLVRKIPHPGDTVFTLTRETIESPWFQGDAKRFRWVDIETCSVETVSGTRLLQLKLKAQPDQPDRRDFLSGRNPRRPTATLQHLKPETQEALLDAIGARLRPTGMALLDSTPAPAAATANPLREAREWQERLQALAPRTWITWGLIALNVLAWGAMVATGSSVLQGDAARLYAWGGNAASAVQAGDWWRLLSATFLHAGLMHLAFNMLGLFSIGPLVERIYGHAQFLLIYLVSALAGSVASLHFSAQTKVSVGASGAVFGIAGALIVGVYQHRKSLPKHFSRPLISGMLPFVGYSLLMGFTQSNIDNGAHVGGLLAGALVALALPERFDPAHYQRLRLPRSALVVLASALLLPWFASQAAPATVNVGAQMRAMQDMPALAREFDGLVQALRKEAEDVKAGRLGLLQADEASRTVHAPRFAALADRLEATVPHLPDRMGQLGRELLLMSRAFQESLAMESNVVDGRPVPANPARSQELDRQIRASAGRMAQLREANRKRAAP